MNSDLVGYSPEDQPMLYYTYFLSTEDTSAVTDAAGNVTSPALDTFRVFVEDDSGQWMLLSTNNETDDPTHELDEIDNGQGTQVGFDNAETGDKFALICQNSQAEIISS